MNRVILGIGAFSAVLCAAAFSGCSAEQKVSMDQLPAAVKATLDKETHGGQVTESEKEVKNGKTIYSFDAKVDGKEWDIAIAEDGTLLSKELEK